MIIDPVDTQVGDTVEPRYFEPSEGNNKQFEIAEVQNSR